VALAAMAVLGIHDGWCGSKDRAVKAGTSEEVCRKVELMGDVKSGEEWHAAIGEGWVFRVAPIAAVNGHDYTGWDLVVDRMEGGGYPDALLLATPPYGSLNEREVGTTFGLRAQDAIGWNPRRFHFLTSEKDLARGRSLFARMGSAGGSQSGSGGKAAAESGGELLGLMKGASAGQFRVLDAKLSSGTGDGAEFARQWALRLRETPHTVEQDTGKQGQGQSSSRGELKWIRFSVTLWLPSGWRAPQGVPVAEAKCAQ